MKIFVVEEKDILFLLKVKKNILNFFLFIFSFMVSLPFKLINYLKNLSKNRAKLLFDREEKLLIIKKELEKDYIFLLPRKVFVGGKRSSRANFLYNAGFYRVSIKNMPFWVRSKFVFVKCDRFNYGWNVHFNGHSDLFYTYRINVKNNKPIEYSFVSCSSIFNPCIRIGSEGLAARCLF